ncbi:phosphotransferase [Streptomyces sp. NBC_00620]|uniref:phosphotransferase n=1 Tax=unclassified Streptomyces TaxID=2593676 RepID=UPI00224F7119|nr:phosphotransferase [Streptomyces sp. NBC_00620]MCX4973397.1 phosphotransferase [Streptomyces sp. NBC_00620]
MSPEAPEIPPRVAAASAALDAVEGPLSGYHHETYVFPLPAEAGTGFQGRWKCREPRANLLWFDRRCFESEERLLYELQRRIDVIPEVARMGGDVDLQRFIEGSTLGALHPSGRAVPDELVEQILGLFRQLGTVTASTLLVERRCTPQDRAEDGDSAGFLDRLICFTQEQVYERNLIEYKGLFADLGLDPEAFRQLRKRVAGLRDRPFCLLHADLHRENFIVDPDGKLWAIDWELAMFGDPLYDLATHLHLMGYPPAQERLIVQRWCGIVEEVRPGSSRGWCDDLPRLLDFKKAQSVFTDVIRASQILDTQGEFDRQRLRRAAWKLRGVLTAAAEPLGLESVPGLLETEAALTRWRSDHEPT